MKSLKLVTSLSFLAVFFSCSDDDDNIQIINEEEVITTLTVTLVEENTGDVKILQYRDLDGDAGPTPPVISTENLNANTTYSGSIQFLNELEDPIEDITEEVVEEADEHQVFFINASALKTSFTYLDQDEDNNPIGVEFSLTTGDVSNGNLSVILIHDGDKFAEGAAEGNLSNVGGETDIEANFNLVIE